MLGRLVEPAHGRGGERLDQVVLRGHVVKTGPVGIERRTDPASVDRDDVARRHRAHPVERELGHVAEVLALPGLVRRDERHLVLPEHVARDRVLQGHDDRSATGNVDEGRVPALVVELARADRGPDGPVATHADDRAPRTDRVARALDDRPEVPASRDLSFRVQDRDDLGVRGPRQA
ncbi:hypothetical protein D3C74_394740 [compost metagenome]